MTALPVGLVSVWRARSFGGDDFGSVSIMIDTLQFKNLVWPYLMKTFERKWTPLHTGSPPRRTSTNSWPRRRRSDGSAAQVSSASELSHLACRTVAGRPDQPSGTVGGRTVGGSGADSGRMWFVLGTQGGPQGQGVKAIKLVQRDTPWYSVTCNGPDDRCHGIHDSKECHS